MINLYDLTVLFVDQVVTAATEGPVVSVTRLRARVEAVGLIDAVFFEEICHATMSFSFILH